MSDKKMTLKSPSNTSNTTASLSPLSSSSLSSSSSSSPLSSSSLPLLSFRASKTGSKCPFGNDKVEFDLYPGGCVWLQGASGRGKTTLTMYLAGLSPRRRNQVLDKLDIQASVQWNPSIAEKERCGVLFQQTTLLDELTVAGNLSVALQKHDEDDDDDDNKNSKKKTTIDRDLKIKQLLDTVGLDYHRDASKRVAELSGGMGRRASLALQLAQCKQVIVLDEPFTGLDHDTAISIAKELVHLRTTQQTAFILITHQYDIAEAVMDPSKTSNNVILHLDEPSLASQEKESNEGKRVVPSLFGTTLRDRVLACIFDYIGWSLPLILLTFTATGLAIAMLSADSLRRIDVTNQVLEIVEKEVKPMIKMLTGEDPSMLTMMGVKIKVRGMLNTSIPPAKATLYAMGLSKLMVLEVGPLLTALLLTGRIGGSYAGKIATLHATHQTDLLKTLGIHPWMWSLVPSLTAALLAAPILTVIGTFLSLYLGGLVGPRYGIGTWDGYWTTIRETTFPDLRLQRDSTSLFYVTTTFSKSHLDALIELLTWPPIFHLFKAVTFMAVTMAVSQICASWKFRLTPRDVPTVITSSVVIAGLMVIFADWGFSQLWMLRY